MPPFRISGDQWVGESGNVKESGWFAKGSGELRPKITSFKVSRLASESKGGAAKQLDSGPAGGIVS